MQDREISPEGSGFKPGTRLFVISTVFDNLCIILSLLLQIKNFV